MTTIATIVKATATKLTTACGITVESTSKGVPGQFDKVINLINQLPEGEVVVEAGKLKGVFKALKENSKDCTTYSFVLACNEWGLEPKGDNSWVIVRPQGNITLINGSYSEPTQLEEVEMKIEDSFNFKYLPFKEQADINDIEDLESLRENVKDIIEKLYELNLHGLESYLVAIRKLEHDLKKFTVAIPWPRR